MLRLCAFNVSLSEAQIAQALQDAPGVLAAWPLVGEGGCLSLSRLGLRGGLVLKGAVGG